MGEEEKNGNKNKTTSLYARELADVFEKNEKKNKTSVYRLLLNPQACSF